MTNRTIIAGLLIFGLLVGYSALSAQSGKNNFRQENRDVNVYSTAENTPLRLSHTGRASFQKADQPLETEVCVFVDPAKTYQTFLGIGGAVTDASAEVFAALPADRQEEFLKAYFDKDAGIGYSLLRTTIHSCDFSSGSYTYVREGDKDLASFDIGPDRAHRIPMLRRILGKTGDIPIYASPWSPPAFMKDNNSMLRGGKLLPAYRGAWANYYTRFIGAYEREGIPIWGISVQNEPMATQRWESCIYSADEERDFLKKFLGPAMKKAGYGDKKIIVWDHNRDLINHRVSTILSDKKAAKYVWGVGFHWYETWTGGQPMFDNLGTVHADYPDVNLIFTEGCNEKFDAAKYQYWPNAERYGRSMINDFNQGTVAWTDWNILLDQTGGPNHVGNFCFAPVHADTRTGELIYTPAYYYIGHFSKFIRPGAKRISTAPSRSHLLSTTFVNPDGHFVTVVMNHTDQPIAYKLYVGDHAAAQEIPAHGMQTLIY